MSVIAAAAGLVIVLALIEVPLGRRLRNWRRHRERRSVKTRPLE